MKKSGFSLRHASAVVVFALTCVAFHPTCANAQELPEYRSPLRDPNRITRYHLWSWKELHEKNIVMQQRDFSCGAAALATVLQYYWGDPVTELQVLKQFDELFTPADVKDRIENGLTITDLRRAAVKLGYQASIGTLRYDQLQESKVPLVVGITVGEFKHFVVYRGTDGYYVYLADPARGNIRVPASEFVKQWQKNAVLVVAKKGEEPKSWSPLAVRPEEIYQGHLNRVEIQKRLTRPAVILPAPRPWVGDSTCKKLGAPPTYSIFQPSQVGRKSTF